MASTKKLYVGEYLAKGMHKTVFNVVEHILPDGVKNLDQDISLTPEQLEQICIDVNSTIDVNSVVVSRIPLYTDDYEKNIENINIHLMFASLKNAPQKYGGVFVAESNGSIETNESIISPGIHIGNPYEPDDYIEKNISVYIFQERCIMDLKKQIDNIVSNIKKAIKPESTIDEIIFGHLDDSILRYIDEMEIIELDYKSTNICLQKIDGPQKYKWTSFDFETIFTRSFRSLPLALKKDFAKYAKMYMVILMLVTVSYSFRTPKHVKPADEIKEIKNIIKEKLTTVYHINFNTIIEILTFFDDFKPGEEHWDYEIFTRNYNPEQTLFHYAGEYFGPNFANRHSDTLLPEHIQEDYKKYGPVKSKERTATLVCGILGLELNGGGGCSLLKTTRLGGRKTRSKKSILTKKHLNKRASTYTNARTKKSNPK